MFGVFEGNLAELKSLDLSLLELGWMCIFFLPNLFSRILRANKYLVRVLRITNVPLCREAGWLRTVWREKKKKNEFKEKIINRVIHWGRVNSLSASSRGYPPNSQLLACASFSLCFFISNSDLEASVVFTLCVFLCLSCGNTHICQWEMFSSQQQHIFTVMFVKSRADRVIG